jgi:hypothetical protein
MIKYSLKENRSKFADYFKHIYKCGPIDFFEPFMPYKNYVFYEANCEEYNRYYDKFFDDRLNMLIFASYLLAKVTDWEGDIRDRVYVFPVEVQNGEQSNIAIVFKQDNNGTTYIISPIELNDFLRSFREEGLIFAEGHYDSKKKEWTYEEI